MPLSRGSTGWQAQHEGCNQEAAVTYAILEFWTIATAVLDCVLGERCLVAIVLGLRHTMCVFYVVVSTK